MIVGRARDGLIEIERSGFGFQFIVVVILGQDVKGDPGQADHQDQDNQEHYNFLHGVG